MNEKEIKLLLEAYYSGTATSREEEQLKSYFLNTRDIPEDLEADKKCFEILANETEIRLPEGMTERLEKKIDQLAQQEKKRNFRIVFYRIGSVAAIIALCMGLFLAEKMTPPSSSMADTFTDPVEAAIAAEEALTFISQQLNLGISQMKEAGEEIQKVNELVRNNLID